MIHNYLLRILIDLTGAALLVLPVFCFISISVSWKRYFILGTKPTPFYFGRYFWIYSGWMLFAGVICLVICFPIYKILLAIAHHPHNIYIRFLLMIISLLPAILIICRNILFFVSKAIGNSTLDLQKAGQLMVGNTLSFFIGFISTIIPFQFASVFLNYIDKSSTEDYTLSIHLLMYITSNILALSVMILGSSMEAYAYKKLVLNRLDNPLPPIET